MNPFADLGGDEQLENAILESAQQVLGFCEKIIEDLYLMPMNVAALRRARDPE